MSSDLQVHGGLGGRSRQVSWSAVAAIACVIGACAVAGGVYGSRLGSAKAASARDSVQDDVREFQAVLGLVEENYAEVPRSDALIYDGAIPAMLQKLDPHSMFFNPEAFARLREDQRGSYAGVGMLIRPYYGETIVDYPFPGTPAFEAGIRPSDAIVEVDDVSMAGVDFEEVAQRVRGPDGTSVHLTLRRQGVDDLIEIDVIRANIPRPSLPLAFFVDQKVGYIKITNFGETTGNELDDALDRLEKDGLEGLVLDLRSNQGGLLTGGVRVADRFLDRGQTIVSHRGRVSDESVYKVRRGQKADPYPMAVLVNCGSASAAEIVAGALQDHDRALIVGTNTFGKGLVQSVFDLPNSTGLVLTTARYYTPSGRLIQRHYDNGAGGSYYRYYADPCDPNYEPLNEDPRLTDSGRAVYGGAGITPDVRLPPITLDAFQRRLRDRRAFEGYAQQFSLRTPTLPENWDLTASVIADFREYLEEEGIPFTEADFETSLPHIRRMLKKHIYTAVADYDEGMRVDTVLDPAVRRAIELLPEARALLQGRTTESAPGD